MPVLVVLSRETFDVIVTCLDGTLFRSLVLVGDSVSLHILELLEALWTKTA